jgi:hypothetical protein
MAVLLALHVIILKISGPLVSIDVHDSEGTQLPDALVNDGSRLTEERCQASPWQSGSFSF